MKTERDAKKPQHEARELRIENLDQDQPSHVTDEQADALRGGAATRGFTDVVLDPPAREL